MARGNIAGIEERLRKASKHQDVAIETKAASIRERLDRALARDYGLSSQVIEEFNNADS